MKASRPEEFLAILSEAEYVSGQALAARAGISRSAVWKQIRMLRRRGYSIESLHGRGYRLAATTDSPVPWELGRTLKTAFVGKSIIYKEAIDSTQNLAMSLAAKPDSHGIVVIAEQQKSGRGRQKRKWLSPKEGIWLSVVLKPEIPTARITILPLVAAIAVCDAVREVTGLDAQLKWPNDVMVSGKKVAGILLDISAEAEQVNYAVIGIGVNVNIDSSELLSRLDTKLQITSIKDELGRNASRLDLTRRLLEKLEYYYLELEHHGSAAIVRAWKKNSDMLDRKVAVMQNGRTVYHGIASDVNEDGSLLLRTESGRVNIASGDIHVRY